MDWYYARGRERIGPLSQADLEALVTSGDIGPDTLVWHPGLPDWQPYRAVAQAASEGGPVTEMAYAGFWIRLVAKIVDRIILAAVNAFMMFFLGTLSALMTAAAPEGALPNAVALVGALLFQLVSIAIAAGYTTFFLGRFGATPGKMVFGLRVVDAGGQPIGYLRALARHFAEWLSMLTLFIGYIIAAFDAEKRTLHDHICSTRVIHR